MIRKNLILRLFDAAYMQRWNDKLRPTELMELDKQGHKMLIAYLLGQFEQDRPGFDWQQVIEGGIFQLLQRIVTTDIKPPVFYRIQADRSKYQKLNQFVYDNMVTNVAALGEPFCRRFREFLFCETETPGYRVLNAAHNLASQWEFKIIERANPDDYEIADIREDIAVRIEHYRDLEGLKQIATHTAYQKFIDLCGRLRFQQRWSNLHRVPRTSVLGHSLFVAILAYLFSLELGACPRRCANNFFTGLFHDLPEVLTRDIISPVKTSIAGLEDLIKDIEHEQMESRLYPLLPPQMHEQVRMFTEREFTSIVTVHDNVVETTSEEISLHYNDDCYNPRDGQIVKVCDILSAFVEATVAIANGCTHVEYQLAKLNIKQRFQQCTIAGINFGEIFADF